MRKRIESLSAAQRRVLFALADGRLNKQIAGELDITEATVKAHLSAIFRKLGVLNRTQAILAVRDMLGGGMDAEPDMCGGVPSAAVQLQNADFQRWR